MRRARAGPRENARYRAPDISTLPAVREAPAYIRTNQTLYSAQHYAPPEF